MKVIDNKHNIILFDWLRVWLIFLLFLANVHVKNDSMA